MYLLLIKFLLLNYLNIHVKILYEEKKNYAKFFTIFFFLIFANFSQFNHRSNWVGIHILKCKTDKKKVKSSIYCVL